MPRVLSNKILFADTDNNKGIISYKQNQFNFTKALNCVQGLTSESQLTVTSGAVVSVASNITDAETDALTLQGINSGTLSLNAPAVLTPYTLTMPPAQGTEGDYLMLSSKTDNVGSLAWAAVGDAGGGGSTGQEQAWVFGQRKQLWSGVTDPSTSAKIPVNISYISGTAPSWATNGLSGGGKVLTLGGSNAASANWDQGISSTYWDFRASCMLGGGSSGSFFFFGNDTYENVNGNAANFSPTASDGIVFEYYPNNSSYGGQKQIKYYENGVLKKTFPLLQAPDGISYNGHDGMKEYRIVRKDRVVRFEVMPSAGSYKPTTYPWNTHVILEVDMTEGFNPTGTRWGFATYNGGVSYSHIAHFEVRTYN